jgi:hypothetical protein
MDPMNCLGRRQDRDVVIQERSVQDALVEWLAFLGIALKPNRFFRIVFLRRNACSWD